MTLLINILSQSQFKASFMKMRISSFRKSPRKQNRNPSDRARSRVKRGDITNSTTITIMMTIATNGLRPEKTSIE